MKEVLGVVSGMVIVGGAIPYIRVYEKVEQNRCNCNIVSREEVCYLGVRYI